MGTGISLIFAMFIVITMSAMERAISIQALNDELFALFKGAKMSPAHMEVQVKNLLERGAQAKAVEKKGAGWTPLHWAAYKGCKNVVSILLSYDADSMARHDFGGTPLHVAAEAGHEDVLKELLDWGAAINEVGGCYGRTPLHWAAHKGHIKAVKVLLDYDADVNVIDTACGTSLYYASSQGYEEMVAILLSSGAYVGLTIERGALAGKTPLHGAAEGGHIEIVKVLVAHGAKINAIDKVGLTPLHFAAENGHKEVVSVLCARGADIQARDKNSRMPIHLAAMRGDSATVEALISPIAAHVNAKDKNGRTPLHCAGGKEYKKVIEVLLSHGAYVNALDNNGCALLDEVINSSYLNKKEIIETLISYGVHIANNSGSQEALHYIAVHCGKELYRAVIVNSFFLPPFDKIKLAEGRSRLRVLLWLFKKLGLPRDLSYFILLKDETAVHDMFVALLPRIEKGLELNCLMDCMKETPLYVRPMIIAHIFEHTIQQLQQIMKQCTLNEEFNDALFDADSVEAYLGEEIRLRIGTLLGFRGAE